jgi:hypothetical protein
MERPRRLSPTNTSNITNVSSITNASNITNAWNTVEERRFSAA